MIPKSSTILILPTFDDCVAIKKDILYNKNNILAGKTYLIICLFDYLRIANALLI